jgi:hypothetical protein
MNKLIMNNELKQISSQILSAMLSNPHIYPQVSDEGGYGKMEQQLILISVEMAEILIQQIENTHSSTQKELEQKN